MLKKHKGGAAAADTKAPIWLNETDSLELKKLVEIKTREELSTILTQAPYKYDTNNKTLTNKQVDALKPKSLKEDNNLKKLINTLLIPNLPAGTEDWRTRFESDDVPEIQLLLDKIIIPILTKYKEHTIDDKGELIIDNIRSIFQHSA